MLARHAPKVLVIGAGGQLGAEIMLQSPSQWRLVTVARQRRRPSSRDDVRLLDLSDADQVRRVIRHERPEVIINAAAYTAVDQAEGEPDVAMAINGVAPGILAEEGARIGAFLVHYSTDYVFDGSGSRPWSEEDPPHPVNVYGLTKLAGEEEVRRSGARYVIMRTSWLYGENRMNFVKKILALSHDRDEIHIVDDEIGAPTSTRFVAEVTSRCVGRWLESRVDVPAVLGTLHVTCAGETSWYGFAEEILRLRKERDATASIPRLRRRNSDNSQTAARRPKNSRLDLGKLRRLALAVIPDWRDELRRNWPAIDGQFARDLKSEPTAPTVV